MNFLTAYHAFNIVFNRFTSAEMSGVSRRGARRRATIHTNLVVEDKIAEIEKDEMTKIQAVEDKMKLKMEALENEEKIKIEAIEKSFESKNFIDKNFNNFEADDNDNNNGDGINAAIDEIAELRTNAQGGDKILTQETLNIVRDAMIAAKKADEMYGANLTVVDENGKIYSRNGGELEVLEGKDGDFISWKAWYDGLDDVTVIGAKEDSCYIAFRSTTRAGSDWDDNIDNRAGKLRNNCMTPSGAYRGWHNNYYDAMMNELNSCVQEHCDDPDGKDCIVITGFSQGGGIAGVATVALFEYRPKMTVVFAAPRSLQQGCNPWINSDRYIRFCNSGTFGYFGYDLVCEIPMGAWSSLVSFGHYFVLPPGGYGEDTHLQYYGKQVGTYPPRLETQQVLVDTAALATYVHSIYGTYSSYDTKIFECAANPSICTARGFANDVRCHSHHNCESGRCNFYGLCAPKLSLSSTCQYDEDCQSGRCSSWFQCSNKVGRGGGCGEDEDCQSGLKCEASWWGFGGSCN